MNSPSHISMIHDMLEEHHRVHPILIDQDILRDYDAEVTVHPCNWAGCTMHTAVEQRQVAKHLQKYHGISTSATSEDTQQILCLWAGCPNSHMKPGNLPRHVVSHLGVRWHCSMCKSSLSREDAFRRHTLEKPDCQHAKAIVKCGGESLVIDTVSFDGGWSASQNVLCIP
ncbi:hypothetical protein BDR04DRAFT_119221 [Suillus decipiens]|nr:hypothetical protein BDR04DRAFT_119221 [Suillus decipiens]